jgi:hypothetical protein
MRGNQELLSAQRMFRGEAMSKFHLTVADNMAALAKWHTVEHPLTSWAACPHSPCDHMDTEFRRCWK